jgi:iron complex outermembrane receptor protein
VGGRASYGRAFATGLDFLVSASVSDSKGRRLFFPEYDDPATNNGISDGADGESFRKLLATASKGSFSFQASNLYREKHIPTGAYGTLFNDPRTKTVDSLSLASLSYSRAFRGDASLTARVHGGYWLYEGDYPYVAGLDVSRDEDYGEWWGLDVDGARRFGRHFLTVGAEYRDNYRQDLRSLDREPLFIYTDLKNGSKRWGAFAQDEIKLIDPLTLYAGVRYDRYESFGSMVSPRAGLIYSPDSATTVKLLAGRAFRAPSEFELYYESFDYAPNPALRPERIETLELVAQRRVGAAQFTVSAFQNRLSALISQFVAVDERLKFENVGDIESKGIELGLRVNRGHGPTGQVTYSLQRTVERATGARLTNSPAHMVHLEILAPFAGRFIAGLDAQHVSGRGTIRGNTAHPYTLANLSFLAPRVFGRFDVTATLYNAFDVEYGVPWGEDVLQEIIQQDGRSFRVKTTLRF